MSDGYQILSLDEIEPVSYIGSNLIPVRHTLGWRAVGLNAWAGNEGEQLIPPHQEDAGNEELYVVMRGRATFTVGDEERDAPEGSLVFVPDEVHRTAVAAKPGTVVLAIGSNFDTGFQGGAWDTFAVADALRRAGRSDEGRAVLQQTIDEKPEAWARHYNAACWEALDGNADAAFARLRRALELNQAEIREYLDKDSDLESLRSDPRWEELAQ
jgi:tetratricopeptide (TPR) repeat protein